MDTPEPRRRKYSLTKSNICQTQHAGQLVVRARYADGTCPTFHERATSFDSTRARRRVADDGYGDIKRKRINKMLDVPKFVRTMCGEQTCGRCRRSKGGFVAKDEVDGGVNG